MQPTMTDLVKHAAFLMELQKEVDKLRQCPELKYYVDQHKLRLIDDKFADIDNFLDLGLIN